MALLVAEGFEHIHGLLDVQRRFPGSTITGIPATLTPQSGRLAGSRCLRAQNGESFAIRSAALAPGSITAILGFAARTNGSASSGLSVGVMSAANLQQIRVTVENNGGVQQVYLRRGATVLCSVDNIPIDTFVYVEFRAKIDPTFGEWELRVNDLTIGFGTGNTSNTGTSGFSKLSITASADAGVSNHADIDDLYLLDGVGERPYDRMLGSVGIECLYPIRLAEDVLGHWTPNTGLSREAVDDGEDGIVDDDAGYVENLGLGIFRDLYDMSKVVSIRSSVLDLTFAVDAKNLGISITQVYLTSHLGTVTTRNTENLPPAGAYARYAVTAQQVSVDDLGDTTYGYSDTAADAVPPVPL